MVYGNNLMYLNVPTPTQPSQGFKGLSTICRKRKKSRFHIVVHNESNYHSYDAGTDCQVQCRETGLKEKEAEETKTKKVSLHELRTILRGTLPSVLSAE